MYLYLDKNEAKVVASILLEKQIEMIDICEEELRSKDFNVARYNGADYMYRAIGLIMNKAGWDNE